MKKLIITGIISALSITASAQFMLDSDTLASQFAAGYILKSKDSVTGIVITRLGKKIIKSPGYVVSKYYMWVDRRPPCVCNCPDHSFNDPGFIAHGGMHEYYAVVNGKRIYKDFSFSPDK